MSLDISIQLKSTLQSVNTLYNALLPTSRKVEDTQNERDGKVRKAAGIGQCRAL